MNQIGCNRVPPLRGVLFVWSRFGGVLSPRINRHTTTSNFAGFYFSKRIQLCDITQPVKLFYMDAAALKMYVSDYEQYFWLAWMLLLK
jgi:hypothetical protein